jgi:hypothetical protein
MLERVDSLWYPVRTCGLLRWVRDLSRRLNGIQRNRSKVYEREECVEGMEGIGKEGTVAGTKFHVTLRISQESGGWG